jgi:hypothetical protein
MSAAASTILDFSVDFAGPRLRLDEPDDGLFVLGTTGTPEKQDTHSIQRRDDMGSVSSSNSSDSSALRYPGTLGLWLLTEGLKIFSSRWNCPCVSLRCFPSPFRFSSVRVANLSNAEAAMRIHHGTDAEWTFSASAKATADRRSAKREGW